MADWKLAPALARLREQINFAYPHRSKTDDGTIGDERHQASKSDHNPNSHGVVCAIDFTHDPKGGFDSYAFAEYQRTHPDPRTQYVISNGKIWNPDISPEWRKYTGTNKHDRHVHISARQDPAIYNIADDWDIGAAKTLAQRHQMAKAILDFEARRDSKGHLKVYQLPANDGGGRFEVGGINEKYDGPMARKLAALVESGHYAEAEDAAIEYIAQNTDPAAAWTTVPAVESYLRDCVFNRGVKGAARILQRAVGVKDDGFVGPITRAAAEKFTPVGLLRALREARESYERNVVGYRANFWAGLTNRWNKALVTAQTFLEQEK